MSPLVEQIQLLKHTVKVDFLTAISFAFAVLEVVIPVATFAVLSFAERC